MSRLIAVCLALVIVGSADAGPFRRRAAVQQPTYSPSVSSYSTMSAASSTYTEGSVTTTTSTSETTTVTVEGAVEALGEVNAKRAARGLRPLIMDPNLTIAAQRTASFRARNLLFGHVTGGSGDFGFLPPGTQASSAGCAAYPESYGWLSCCTYEGYTYGGAAWALGRDGKRYMHLFVR